MEDHDLLRGNAVDDLAIVALVLNQIRDTEQRITRKIDENSEAAKLRWGSHDAEHADLAAAVRRLGERLDDHLKDEEREQLVFDARMGPFRRLMSWLGREWRTVLLVMLLLADFLSTVVDGVFRR